jgi:hypothetical protein
MLEFPSLSPLPSVHACILFLTVACRGFPLTGCLAVRTALRQVASCRACVMAFLINSLVPASCCTVMLGCCTALCWVVECVGCALMC